MYWFFTYRYPNAIGKLLSKMAEKAKVEAGNNIA